MQKYSVKLVFSYDIYNFGQTSVIDYNINLLATNKLNYITISLYLTQIYVVYLLIWQVT